MVSGFVDRGQGRDMDDAGAVGLACLTFGSQPPPLLAALNAQSGASIASAFEAAVAKNNGYGGGVVRVESSRSGVLYEQSWGLTQRGSGGVAMPLTASFEIASVTKTFTATVIMILVTRGLLALHDSVGHVLPKLVSRLDAPKHVRQATVLQLMQHTSGIPDYWSSVSFNAAFEGDVERYWGPEELLPYAFEMPPLTPGVWSYADTNYVLLGLAVEDRTGLPLHEFMKREMFLPLGMHHTYMSYKEKAPLGSPILSHRYEGHEDLIDKPRQSADWAGGGLISTTRDLSIFIRALAEGRIFGSHTNVLKHIVGNIVATDMEGVFYGSGVFEVDESDDAGGCVWGHDGWGNSFMWYHAPSGVAVTGTLNQHSNDDWGPAAEVFKVLGSLKHITDNDSEADRGRELTATAGSGGGDGGGGGGGDDEDGVATGDDGGDSHDQTLQHRELEGRLGVGGASDTQLEVQSRIKSAAGSDMHTEAHADRTGTNRELRRNRRALRRGSNGCDA